MKKLKEINQNDVKKHLKELSKNELEKEVLNLYKKFKDVKEYFSIELNKDNLEGILSYYKEKISNEFIIERDIEDINFRLIRKYISDFKKNCSNSRYVVDLILYAVEQGVLLIDNYGDITEQFYISVEKLFADATKHMRINELTKEYVKRCKKIVDDSSNVGWGFSDTMYDIYYESFSEYIDFEE